MLAWMRPNINSTRLTFCSKHLWLPNIYAWLFVNVMVRKQERPCCLNTAARHHIIKKLNIISELKNQGKARYSKYLQLQKYTY
jgi:hypothetical protein